MRVITLDRKEFRCHCKALAQKVETAAVRTDAIVGIATGGIYVAREMQTLLNVPLFEVSLHRSGDKNKKGFFAGVIARLPRKVADYLRITESRIRVLLPKKIKEVNLPEDLASYIDTHPGASILVVDDAVDSGSTLASIVAAIRKRQPSAAVATAVITVTTRRPLIHPDVALYDDNTLIRFPWSLDSHE